MPLFAKQVLAYVKAEFDSLCKCRKLFESFRGQEISPQDCHANKWLLKIHAPCSVNEYPLGDRDGGNAPGKPAVLTEHSGKGVCSIKSLYAS